VSDKYTLSQAMRRELRECLRCGTSLHDSPTIRLCGKDYTAHLLEDRPNGVFMVQAKSVVKGEKSFIFKVDVQRCTQEARQMMLHEALGLEEEEECPNYEAGVFCECDYCRERAGKEDEKLPELLEESEPEPEEEITVLPTAGKTKAPEVVIPLHVYSKIVELCLKSGTLEIAWFGTIVMRGNEIYIDEVYLPRQEIGVVTAEITGIAEVASEFVNQGRIDDCERLRFWGHCHPGTNLPAPSSVDLGTYEQLCNDCPTFLMGIFSCDGTKGYFRLRHHGLDMLLPWRVVTSAGSNFPDFNQKVKSSYAAAYSPRYRYR